MKCQSCDQYGVTFDFPLCRLSKIMQLLPAGGATTNVSSKVLTSHMIESSRKVNSIGQCDRVWHSTTTLRPSCLYPNTRVLAASARGQIIVGSPPQRRRSALQSRNFPPSENWALGCVSEMSARRVCLIEKLPRHVLSCCYRGWDHDQVSLVRRR